MVGVGGARHRHHDRTATAATAALNCAEGCGINLPEALTHLTDRVFAIVIQDFQDPYTLNVKQLMKCCVQQITPDGRLIPFCAYNSVGYREQVREQLTGVPVPDIVPNAIPLAGLLADAPHGSKQANTGGSIARLAGPTRGAPMALPPHQIKACCADAIPATSSPCYSVTPFTRAARH